MLGLDWKKSLLILIKIVDYLLSDIADRYSKYTILSSYKAFQITMAFLTLGLIGEDAVTPFSK